METDTDRAEPTAMMELAPGDIHLWLAFYDQITDERLHAKYRRWLNAQEQEQQRRFHFARDRLCYLVTRALIRTVLSRYLPMAPEQWLFATNPHGRPHIANAHTAASALRFNISHTHSLIVLAVANGREIGVDVENVHARPVSIDIADRFFSPEEVAALANVPREQQQDRFFEYWTFKESYIKARGLGLSIPLDKFSFRCPHERTVELAIDASLNDDPRRWQFWQFRPTPQYLVAVCAERLAMQASQLVVRKIVPAGAEQALVPALLRCSG